MEIDIIDYTEAQLAALTAGQLQQVLSAQKKKNALLAALDKKIAAAKAEVIGNGTFHSDFWESMKADMKVECDAEIEALREGLLFYLHYAVQASDSEIRQNGYEVDYSLSVTERYQQVKAYYESEYEDPQARFDAFQNDKIAETYLGELYYTLYDVIRAQAEAV